MYLAIIIPFYNGQNFLKPCLESIEKAFDYLDEETKLRVYIVDNSPVGMRNYINFSEKKFDIEVIDAKPQIGFGRACNLGVYSAIKDGAEYTMILNQDTVVFKDSLYELISYLKNENNPKTVLGPIIYDYDCDKVEKKFIQWYLFQSPMLVTNLLESKKLKKLYKVEWLSGACLVFHRDVVESLGLFEPLIHLYGEDTELCQRYVKNKVEFCLLPKFKIGHNHSNKGGFIASIELEKKYSTLVRKFLMGDKVFSIFFALKLFFLSVVWKNFVFAKKLFPRIRELWKYGTNEKVSLQNRITFFNKKSL